MAGQTITLGTRSVRGANLENIRLGALPGADTVTFHGTVGRREDYAIAASTVAGSARVSIPNSAAVDLIGAEGVSVNGNTADGDTLAVSATANADTRQ